MVTGGRVGWIVTGGRVIGCAVTMFESGRGIGTTGWIVATGFRATARGWAAARRCATTAGFGLRFATPALGAATAAARRAAVGADGVRDGGAAGFATARGGGLSLPLLLPPGTKRVFRESPVAFVVPLLTVLVAGLALAFAIVSSCRHATVVALAANDVDHVIELKPVTPAVPRAHHGALKARCAMREHEAEHPHLSLQTHLLHGDIDLRYGHISSYAAFARPWFTREL